jgi:hypothetical protein
LCVGRDIVSGDAHVRDRSRAAFGHNDLGVYLIT